MSNSLFDSRNGFAQAYKWGHALFHSGIITRAFNSKPIWAQLQITERCNLQCGYCSEHKNDGVHVAYGTVTEWIRRCSMLGVKHIEFIGGEPLLHPDLLKFTAMARELKMGAGLTTNGFMLNRRRAGELIAGGINRLQLSIDCMEPNDITQKALNLLRPQLELMSNMKIWVHVNSVLTEETLPQARELALNLFRLDVPVAFSPAHDHGRLQIGSTSDSMIEFFDWLSVKKRQGHPVNMAQFLLNYYRNKMEKNEVPWTCVGGTKAFYVDSMGRFCICSHKPTALKFEDINPKTLRDNYRTRKGCEDSCGVSCMIVNSFPFCRLWDVIRADILPTIKVASI